MDQHQHTVRRLVDQIRADVARATGRRYQIDWEALGVDGLREMLRLLRDLDYEKRASENHAR
ncbi:MAG: hypothetical protein KAI24_24605, partial [Planctomycetes bacterium]|nr:hypothetical protein [Planctomycetota bacterium]